MKKIEYKIVVIKTKLGFNLEKKSKEFENELNELGQQGWRFCSWVNGGVLFMREIEE
ncbi:DUF4177 domain-containing protein [Lutibacter sp. B2]|nr:DUF4177 domain-containing protein [Lutibacter sp. B2]